MIMADEPFAYAYRYPSYPPEGSTVIRFGTNGREINGSKPIEAIPLYTRPLTGGVTPEMKQEIALLLWNAPLNPSMAQCLEMAERILAMSNVSRGVR
jgi:hypothetical protein